MCSQSVFYVLKLLLFYISALFPISYIFLDKRYFSKQDISYLNTLISICFNN